MTKQIYKLTQEQRQRRHFSASFKKSKVQEIESGISRLSDIKREYEVSYTSIYKWINKYGMSKSEKKERLIVESESDAVKLRELRKRLAELERVVGQKQLQIDFKDKMIELAEQHYEVDIKKKFMDSQSGTSGKID